MAIAQRVREALEEIVNRTNQVNALLAEIAASSQEQAGGIKQINSAVGELDNVTQQNAGNAEELASSAEETAAQVVSLREVVGRFHVADEDGGEAPRTQRAPHQPVRTAARAALPASSFASPGADENDFESF